MVTDHQTCAASTVEAWLCHPHSCLLLCRWIDWRRRRRRRRRQPSNSSGNWRCVKQRSRLPACERASPSVHPSLPIHPWRPLTKAFIFNLHSHSHPGACQMSRRDPPSLPLRSDRSVISISLSDEIQPSISPVTMDGTAIYARRNQSHLYQRSRGLLKYHSNGERQVSHRPRPVVPQHV